MKLWLHAGLALTVLVLSGSAPLGDVEVTLREGTNFALSLSPDGSRLAMDLQGTLWLMPVEGGEARPITDGLGDDRLPDWSPDGEWLAFQSFRSGSWDIWMVRPDGSDLTPLTSGRSDDREPVWSPDGKRIAFSSDRAGHYDLWLLDIDRRETTPLTGTRANDYMPAWSPDGLSLAFLSDRGESGSTELFTLHLGGMREERLALFRGKPASPSWSPDGKHLALTLFEERAYSLRTWRFSEAHTSDLLLVPLPAGEPRRITSGEDVFPFRPAWAGRDVFYTSDGNIYRRSTQSGIRDKVPFTASLTLRRPAYERRAVSFPSGEVVERARGIVRPVLSPDGKTLAFAALGDLWQLRVEGGEPRPLTNDAFLDADPHWSPDGTRLVFATDRAGTMDLWTLAVDPSSSQVAERLTTLPGAEFAPAWSPDGRLIAYLDQDGNVRVHDVAARESRLVRETAGGASVPSWSSDSRHLAFAVRVADSTRFREGANRVLIVDVASGGEAFLEQTDRSFGTRGTDGPVWSPDGNGLAFASEGGLWIQPVTPAGEAQGPASQVFEAPADAPSWSADSKTLFFLASQTLKRLDLGSGIARDVPLDLSYRTIAESGQMVIRDVRVIDGTGAPAREHVDVFIGASRIKAIEPTGGVIPAETRIIEAAGKTLLPGLIEMHTHLSLPQWGSDHGRAFLAYGITSIRTPAMAPYRVFEEREAIESGKRLGPRIFTTGYVVDGDRIYYDGALAVDNEVELRRELDRAFRLRYDFLKTYVRLPDALQKIAIEEAHRSGIPVTSHEIYPAVALGVDGIEHVRGTSRRGFSPKVTELRRSYQDVIELVARSGVYFTPTILIQGGFRLALAREPELADDRRLAALFPAWVRDQAAGAHLEELLPAREEVMKPLFETVARIHEAGGRVVAGTDSPIVPYGLGLILEVEQYAEAGLGPLGAIRAATGHAAEALGAGRDLGTIEPGKLADLVILDGNPIEDIRHLRRTERVILGGREISVEKLLKRPGLTQDR